MRWAFALLSSCLALAGCDRGAEPSAAPAASGREPKAAQAGLRPQPRPGERVRQPELDGYCAEPDRSEAYYYHGGSPVMRVARQDRCAPLYLTECEDVGRCYPPRDQEPGMWCCPGGAENETARATR